MAWFINNSFHIRTLDVINKNPQQKIDESREHTYVAVFNKFSLMLLSISTYGTEIEPMTLEKKLYFKRNKI